MAVSGCPVVIVWNQDSQNTNESPVVMVWKKSKYCSVGAGFFEEDKVVCFGWLQAFYFEEHANRETNAETHNSLRQQEGRAYFTMTLTLALDKRITPN